MNEKERRENATELLKRVDYLSETLKPYYAMIDDEDDIETILDIIADMREFLEDMEE